MIFKRFIQLLKILLGIILAYFLSALILSYIPSTPPESECENDQVIWLHSNGIHLDIAFRIGDLSPEFLDKIYKESEDKIISFGWGDRDFYLNVPTWDDLTFSAFMNALFFNQTSLIHVTRYDRSHKDWTRIHICDHQYKALLSYINHSFKKDKEGKLRLLKVDGYSNRDDFYEAEGVYNVLYTCNTWVNGGLKDAELPASIWTPFDFGVLHWY